MAARHPNHRPPSTLPAEIRDATVPRHVRAWIAATTGATVTDAVQLDGASSVALHRLELSDGTRLALRRYVWAPYIESEPDAPTREVDAIEFARRKGLPAPELIAHDLTGAEIGDGIPAVLMSLLLGEPIAVPDLDRLAEAAAAIHDVDASDLGHEYFPWYEDEMVTPPPLATQPELWERAIDLWHTARPTYRPTLIHRDFHPGNLLWSHGRLTGIVDWAGACRGPIGCDIAHCRANLRKLATPDVADSFVRAYRSLTGYELDPFWIMAGHLEHDHAHWTAEQIAADEGDLLSAARLVARR